MELQSEAGVARGAQDGPRLGDGVCPRLTEHIREMRQLLPRDTRDHFVHEQGDVVRTAIRICACLEGDFMGAEEGRHQPYLDD